jgi:prevent-host-death family protein
MGMVNIQEAKSQLSKLVEQALAGEDVVIARAGKPMVRLIPVHEDDAPRHGGQWKGKVRIADDFDQLPGDIARAVGMEMHDVDRAGLT